MSGQMTDWSRQYPFPEKLRGKSLSDLEPYLSELGVRQPAKVTNPLRKTGRGELTLEEVWEAGDDFLLTARGFGPALLAHLNEVLKTN